VWTERREDDEVALLRCVTDPAAFGALFDRHAVTVHRHCVRQLGTDRDADDLTAVTFLEAWRHRNGIRVVEGSALPWLLVTATNVVRNHRRSMRRYRAALARLPDPAPVPAHSDEVATLVTFRSTAAPLAAALSRLSTVDQQVVSLCLLSDVSYGAAGAVLGLSHGAVRSRLMRARRELREQLEVAGYGHDHDHDEGVLDA
jgi:RNA polymerase sigma-70 factor (ECF subfamily)